MQNIFKTEIKYKEILQKQAITILWGIVFLLLLTIEYFHPVEIQEFEMKEIKTGEMLGAAFVALFSTLSLNSKFNQINFKINSIKLIISTIIAGITFIILNRDISLYENNEIPSLAILIIVILNYYYMEIKKGESLAKLIFKTMTYLTYLLVCYVLMTILIFSIRSLIIIEYEFSELFYLYIYIGTGIIFLVLFQEDKKDYAMDKNELLVKIFKYFLILLVILMYANIFLYGRAKFYVVTHFIFWSGYLILIINIALKNKKIAAIMLPLNVFLIYKISERIRDLGLTEGRYFILVLAILLLVMYIIQLVKPNINEKIFVMLVMISIFITVFIPKINAFDMSRASLSVRANALAEELNKKIKSGMSITAEEAEKMRDYFYYFGDRNYQDNFMSFVEENRDKILTYDSISNGNENAVVLNDTAYTHIEKIREEGLDISGYKKIYEKHIFFYEDIGEINEFKNSEDHKILEKLFKEKKYEILEENKKILVNYADINYNSKLDLYVGEAQVFILEK